MYADEIVWKVPVRGGRVQEPTVIWIETDHAEPGSPTISSGLGGCGDQCRCIRRTHSHIRACRARRTHRARSACAPVNQCTIVDGGRFSMFRRAKLMLADVPAEVLDSAAATGLLVGRLGLTDANGQPRCARVRPPQIRWTADVSQEVDR
jgi:Family of unknown function (DUF5990)